MTRAEFLRVEGRRPEQDDLARANCRRAGQLGHLSCGVCACGRARFLCLRHSTEFLVLYEFRGLQAEPHAVRIASA